MFCIIEPQVFFCSDIKSQIIIHTPIENFKEILIKFDDTTICIFHILISISVIFDESEFLLIKPIPTSRVNINMRWISEINHIYNLRIGRSGQ